jgi:hypothetical protein
MTGLLLPLMMLAVLGSPLTGSFEEDRSTFLSAIQRRDVSSICDALELLAKHDRKETANLFLSHGLPHESLLVHEEALRLARALKSEGAREAIRTTARNGRDGFRRLGALRVIRSCPKVLSRPEVLLRLEDRDWVVVAEAVRALRKRERGARGESHDRARGDPGPVVFCLNTMAMGDLNATEFGQAGHAESCVRQPFQARARGTCLPAPWPE